MISQNQIILVVFGLFNIKIFISNKRRDKHIEKLLHLKPLTCKQRYYYSKLHYFYINYEYLQQPSCSVNNDLFTP